MFGAREEFKEELAVAAAAADAPNSAGAESEKRA